MNNFRIEKDFISEKKIPSEKYYGIETARAIDNFAIDYHPVQPEIIKALAIVKKSALQTNTELGYIDIEKYRYIEQALDEIIQGHLLEYFPVSALQGGAGTALNMNINEVAANRAIELSGRKFGEYDYIHPIETLNLHQSTNDTVPTAVKIAVIYLLRELSSTIAYLQSVFQTKEREFSNMVKIGRTEMRDAVPMTLGQEFSGYSSAIARDRWRTFKCEERLREVNIGGTAIGTGISAPKKYIFLIIEKLRENTGLGLSRADNLIDATANLDTFVEVSAIMKSHAVNLFKIAGDLRLLSSGPSAGISEIELEMRQSGSTIMPYKVNPVIPEMVQQIAMKVIAIDNLITDAVKNASLELNPFLPIIADSLVSSIRLLIQADRIFADKCVKSIKPHPDVMRSYLLKSNEIITAFIHRIGYDTATDIIKKAEKKKIPALEELRNRNILSNDEIEEILKPSALTALGYMQT